MPRPRTRLPAGRLPTGAELARMEDMEQRDRDREAQNEAAIARRRRLLTSAFSYPSMASDDTVASTLDTGEPVGERAAPERYPAHTAAATAMYPSMAPDAAAPSTKVGVRTLEDSEMAPPAPADPRRITSRNGELHYPSLNN